jgi:hypothetical protein
MTSNETKRCLSIHVMSVKVCVAIILCENNNFIFEDLRGFSNPREDPRHSARLTRIIPRQNEDMGGLSQAKRKLK